MSEQETDDAEDAADDTAVGEAARETAGPTRYGAVMADSHGDVVLHPGVDTYLDTAVAARDDGFDQLVDLTAVDFLSYAGRRVLPDGIEPERFEVVVQLINHVTRERIRLRVQVPADDPVVATLFDLWPGAEYLEREVFDMFGISFADHPDLSRILMPEDWEGHPLRKDYGVAGIPVQFKAASNIR